MRAIAVIVAALAGVLVPAGGAAPPPLHPISPLPIQPTGTMAARVVPARVGVRPAEVRLTLRIEGQCGRLGPGPMIVVFPAAERMPASLGEGAVLLNGAPQRHVTLSGHVVAVALPKTSGLTCDVVAPVVVSVVFTKAANLGNPMSPGTYHVSLRAGSHSASAPLVVS